VFATKQLSHDTSQQVVTTAW